VLFYVAALIKTQKGCIDVSQLAFENDEANSVQSNARIDTQLI
jgi:hypothetical protein